MVKEKEVHLSEKEVQARDFILNGPVFKVILRIGLPIAFFQSLNHLFRALDMFMAASIDETAVSMVTYLAQMNMIIGGLGLGLATGATLKISQMYGSGNYEAVRKQISTLLAFAVLASIGMIIIIIPLAAPILRFANMPEELITSARVYFSIEFLGVMLMFLNGIYIALERVQGNAKKILYMNLVAMVIRIGFTAFSIYILCEGVVFIAISIVLSQLFIFAYAIYNLKEKSEVFTFSLKDVTLKREILAPMLTISIPIMIERSAFHVGKVIVNAMIASIDLLVAGGLSISNLICGLGVAPQMGIQDASIPILAQNMGAKKHKRTLEAFKAVFVINMVQAVLLFLPLFIFARQMTGLFAQNNPEFHEIIYMIHIFDVWSVLVLGAYSSVMALLLGLGYTKLTLFLNFCRVFLFRIPVLWFLQNFTNMGVQAAGFVMMFSNVATVITSLIIAVICVRKFCQKHEIFFWNRSLEKKLKSDII